MSKRVLHILNSGSYSGAENVVITIIEAFRRYGDDTEFIYVSLDGSIRNVLEEHNIRFEPVSAVSLSEIRRVNKKYKPDIIHAHDFTAGIICAAVAGRIPIISHLHNNPPWIKQYCLNSFVFGLSCIKYKKILGVSESVFKEFVFGKYIKNKTQVIGNPIDISKIQETAKQTEDYESFDVVFLGRLIEQKDPLKFVDIINKVKEYLPTITAVMMGDGSWRNAVEKKIAEYDLEDTITLKGFISNPYGVLKNSKMLCIPSRWEGFGLAAVEALALGKPVLASPVGGLPGIVTKECGGLFCSEEDFLNEIVKLIENKGYLRDKENRALERAWELDNIEKYTEQIRNTYREIWKVI